MIAYVVSACLSQATEHLHSYDAAGRALFLQTLRIMLAEIDKRYKQVGGCSCSDSRAVGVTYTSPISLSVSGGPAAAAEPARSGEDRPGLRSLERQCCQEERQ